MKSPNRDSSKKGEKRSLNHKNEARTSLDERCLQSALNASKKKIRQKSMRSSQKSFGTRLKSPPIIKTSAHKQIKSQYQKGASKNGKF